MAEAVAGRDDLVAAPAAGRSRVALLLAAVVGGLHALVSLYWGLGGTALVETLGERLLSQFAGRGWLLIPVAAVKVVVALGPLWLAGRGWPWARLTRGVGWLAAAILVAWGGLNTVVANLVLTGLLTPDGGYDRAAMVGHGWLWDPMFLVWGLALAAGLLWTRRVRSA